MALQINDDFKKLIRDYLYPVGSVYISVNNTRPENLFGGTWVRVGIDKKGVYLFAIPDNQDNHAQYYNIGSTYNGENAGHTALSIKQIPKHSHGTGIQPDQAFNATGISGGGNTAIVYFDQSTGKHTTETGGGENHNHTIPCFTVSVWYRIA